MNGWLWLALVLLLLVLLLASRLKFRAEYDEEGFRLAVRFGLLPLFRHPAGSAGKPRKPEKTKEQPKREKKGGKLPEIREILSIFTNTLGKLKRKLRVDELVLWYCSAASDPASAALAFGGASAAAGMLTAPLERSFNIRKRDIRTAVSFTETEPTVLVKLRISVSLLSLLCIFLPEVLRFTKMIRNHGG